MTRIPYLPIFETTRGEIVESIHFGSIAIVNSSGELFAWYGDPQAITYLRSSAKPIQVLPFIKNGGDQAFHLTQREIAVMCASHAGTDEHVMVIQSIQAKTGVKEAELMCGVHPLSHRATAEAIRYRGEQLSQNRHNCSGKHTGMLAYGRLLGVLPSDDLPYIDPAHPVQKSILETFAWMCDVPVEQVYIGVDGCSAPNFAVPLYNAALAMAQLCDPARLPDEWGAACRKVTSAMSHHPDMVGGPDSFDTYLMQVAQGRIICKGGAEGYQALGLMPGALGADSPALGITLKIAEGDLKSRSRLSGDPRGAVRPAVVLELLRQLGALSPDELGGLSGYGPVFALDNWRKIVVGEGRPCFLLERKNTG